MLSNKLIATLTFAVLSFGNAFSANTEVIAHRGYWNTKGSAQNSIRSLVKADSIQCFGSEFDVWYTKDKKLVVNHDESVGGFVIENSKAKDVLAQKLKNGENVSSLEQYLKEGKKLNTRLILEVKPHTDKKHEAKGIKAILKMVKKFGLENRVEYITFSHPGMLELIKHAPKGTPVYYLNGELSPKELKAIGAAGMDYNSSVIKKNPEWIKESHDLGMKVNVWTVNKESDMRLFIDNGVDFITTNEPELLQHILSE